MDTHVMSAEDSQGLRFFCLSYCHSFFSVCVVVVVCFCFLFLGGYLWIYNVYQAFKKQSSMLTSLSWYHYNGQRVHAPTCVVSSSYPAVGCCGLKLRAPPVFGTTGAIWFSFWSIFGSPFLACSLFSFVVLFFVSAFLIGILPFLRGFSPRVLVGSVSVWCDWVGWRPVLRPLFRVWRALAV